MQALYGFLQTENDNLAAGERSLLQSFERIYDLYLLQFALLAEVHRSALLEREESRKKIPAYRRGPHGKHSFYA